MRLEVQGKTEGKATWIPSMLSINLDDDDCTQINYDIAGELSFIEKKFNAYCKGDLLIEEDDDYVEMSDAQIKQLFKMLKNKDNEIIITVYPNEDEEEIDCDASEITNCVAHLEMWDSQNKRHVINFKFIAEYVE